MNKQTYQYKGFLISYHDKQYRLKVRDVKSGRTHEYQRSDIHALMKIIDNIRRFETLPEPRNQTKKSRFWNDQLKQE
ncbi:hypothetical protein AKJ18_10795 [Vibrio xuii]|nr:hypothetical protein AKJ18_10795 [Vibrio xuii]